MAHGSTGCAASIVASPWLLERSQKMYNHDGRQRGGRKVTPMKEEEEREWEGAIHF